MVICFSKKGSNSYLLFSPVTISKHERPNHGKVLNLDLDKKVGDCQPRTASDFGLVQLLLKI